MYSRLTLTLAAAALLLPLAPHASAQTTTVPATQNQQPQTINPAPSPVTMTPPSAPAMAPSSQTTPTPSPASAAPADAAQSPAGPSATAPAAPPAPAGAPAPGTTAATGALRGRAVDSTNAVIPGTTVTLTSTDGKTYTTQSTGDGTFLVPNVAPGIYSVSTEVNGFQASTHDGVKIIAATATRLNLHLDLEVNTVVNVKADNGTQLSVNPDNNASTLTLSGKDLDALSDDPDELSDELNALAGPAAGPNGGQIYIDGFTGGQLPPKSSIREIRINQNPFSAQYDKIGYGRIEVFTKPGTDKLHGSFQLQGNSNAFNTAAVVGGTYQPPYHSLLFQGSLSGPLSKRASYSIGSNYRDIEDNSVINTTIAPGPTFTPVDNFIQAVFYPQHRFDISPRLDLQITPTNTLTARYQFDYNSATNAGLTGGSALPSAASNSTDGNHEIQLSDSQNIGARMVTETRFEYTREAEDVTAQNFQQTASVQGAFTDFGNGTGVQHDVSSHYELQSYTSIQLKNNFTRFGGRLRVNQDTNTSNAGYKGTFLYGQKQVLVTSGTTGSTAYLNATGNSADCPANATSVPDPSNPSGPSILVYFVSGICNYAIVNQQGSVAAYNAGFGPTQYNLTTIPGAVLGSPRAIPAIATTVSDLGLYVEDDWKVRSNLTVTGGLRYETQNHIGDHHDFAPRLSISWGIGTRNNAPLFVLRGGYGLFYDRFALGQVQNTQRFNGVNEAQYTVKNPNPTATLSGPGSPPPANPQVCSPTDPDNIFNCVMNASSSLITYTQAPDLRTPVTMQTGFSLEHQLIKPLTLTLTYLNSRGNHQLFTQNTAFNATPTTANVYQYVSEGVFKQNQFILQGTFRGPGGTSMFGYYTFSHSNADTAGVSSFPSHSSPNNITADYGRSSFDVHQKIFLGGSAPLPYHISLSPFMIATSGAPFNITLGNDLNNDSILNDRPAFCSATTSASNAVHSQYGCFDKGTTAGQARIPINYGQSSALFTFNLRATKTFGFGKYLRGAPSDGGQKHQHGGSGGLAAAGGASGGSHSHSGGDMGFGGGGTSTGRRYNLTIGAQALNLFNVVDYSSPVGVLSSPQFGQQIKLAGGSSGGSTSGIFTSNSAVRRISLQANFTF